MKGYFIIKREHKPINSFFNWQEALKKNVICADEHLRFNLDLAAQNSSVELLHLELHIGITQPALVERQHRRHLLL